jgi:hypothetical protein
VGNAKWAFSQEVACCSHEKHLLGLEKIGLVNFSSLLDKKINIPITNKNIITGFESIIYIYLYIYSIKIDLGKEFNKVKFVSSRITFIKQNPKGFCSIKIDIYI